MSIWLITSLVLLTVCSVLLIIAARAQKQIQVASQKRFFELFVGHTALQQQSWAQDVLHRMESGHLNAWLEKLERPETALLLKQVGWYNTIKRPLFYLSIAVTPVVFVTVVTLYLLSSGVLDQRGWIQIFFAGAVGFLLPKYLLRRKAKTRRQTISREMPTAVHLMRMLFEAGLSTEHVLRVMYTEGQVLTPELAQELKSVLRLIDAGLDPAEALSEMAAPLEVAELSDIVAILRQVSRHGGNIRETLVQFAQLMEERQMSALREYVNVLSGKMSLVMMLFLFPALLIFLAGPGFLALAKGLMGAM